MSISRYVIKRASDKIGKAVGHLRRFSSWLGPSDDWVERQRRRLFVALDPFLRPLGRPLIFHCHDEDYMYTVAKSSDAVERAIADKYQRNLASTRKYRYIDTNGDRRQWTDGSWVYDPPHTDWQHHVYYFDSGDIGHPKTDIYGHKEKSAESDPYGHVTDPQEHGDPDENVVPLLAAAGITRVEE